jgi:hypothetical protein
MKVLLPIFLSLQIMTNCTFFEDVVRIPSLIEHFQHHSAEEQGNLSFFDFIVMHYFSGTLNTDAAHGNLPLNHSGDIGHVHSNSPCTLPESIQSIIIPVREIEHVMYAIQFMPCSNLNSIFQPPKHTA